MVVVFMALEEKSVHQRHDLAILATIELAIDLCSVDLSRLDRRLVDFVIYRTREPSITTTSGM